MIESSIFVWRAQEQHCYILTQSWVVNLCKLAADRSGVPFSTRVSVRMASRCLWHEFIATRCKASRDLAPAPSVHKFRERFGQETTDDIDTTAVGLKFYKLY